MVVATLYEVAYSGVEHGKVSFTVWSRQFEDPQDALKALWDAAERMPEDAGELAATIDGKPVTL